MSLPHSLGVIGVGLLGGSIALDARKLGIRVTGFDRDPDALAYALSHKIIDRAASSVADLICDVDALVLAAPIDAIIDIVHDFRDGRPAAPNTLKFIIDIASVKRQIVAAGAALPQFLGTHPIAGSEFHGPQAAQRELFVNRPWAVIETTDQSLRAAVHDFIRALGGRPVSMNAERHDRVVAATSHVPQAMSSALCAALQPDEFSGLFGTGLLSMIRLSRSPWSMWQSIFATNGPEIASELKRVQSKLSELIAALDSGDDRALAEMFGDAHENLVRLDTAAVPRGK